MIFTAPFDAFYLDLKRNHAQEQMGNALSRDGIVTFDAIHSTDELLRLCHWLGTIVFHRDADATGLTRIVKRPDVQSISSYQAFTDLHLALHTDGSSILNPPCLIVLWCAQPAEEGGASLLADGKQIYQILAKEHPQILRLLTKPNSAVFLGSTTPLYGSVFSVFKNGNTYIRFRYDDLGYYSASILSAVTIFLEILEKCTISLSLKQGQGYIIQNSRWLHGRTAFQGKRELYRALVNPEEEASPGKQILFGFQPTCRV